MLFALGLTSADSEVAGPVVVVTKAGLADELVEICVRERAPEKNEPDGRERGVHDRVCGERH